MTGREFHRPKRSITFDDFFSIAHFPSGHSHHIRLMVGQLWWRLQLATFVGKPAHSSIDLNTKMYIKTFLKMVKDRQESVSPRQ